MIGILSQTLIAIAIDRPAAPAFVGRGRGVYAEIEKGTGFGAQGVENARSAPKLARLPGARRPASRSRGRAVAAGEDG